MSGNIYLDTGGSIDPGGGLSINNSYQSDTMGLNLGLDTILVNNIVPVSEQANWTQASNQGSGVNQMVWGVLNEIINLFLVPLEGISRGVGNAAYMGLTSIGVTLESAATSFASSPAAPYVGLGISIVGVAILGLLASRLGGG